MGRNPRGGARGAEVVTTTHAEAVVMSSDGSQREECKSQRRELALDLDRTEGFKHEYYGRKEVYAANEASEGQDHNE